MWCGAVTCLVFWSPLGVRISGKKKGPEIIRALQFGGGGGEPHSFAKGLVYKTAT